MLPFEVPAGTTADSFFDTLLPAAHPALAEGAATPFRGRWCAALRGHEAGGFTLDLDGGSMKVRHGVDPADAAYATSMSLAHLRAFLDEAARTGKARGPKPRPIDGAFQRRLLLVNGAFRVVIPDFPGAPGFIADIAIAPAGKALDRLEDARDGKIDFTLEIPIALVRAIADGADPSPALQGNNVKLSGKRTLAMALGVALLPLVPPR